jgi:hypothetical protein
MYKWRYRFNRTCQKPLSEGGKSEGPYEAALQICFHTPNKHCFSQSGQEPLGLFSAVFGSKKEAPPLSERRFLKLFNYKHLIVGGRNRPN